MKKLCKHENKLDKTLSCPFENTTVVFFSPKRCVNRVLPSADAQCRSRLLTSRPLVGGVAELGTPLVKRLN